MTARWSCAAAVNEEAVAVTREEREEEEAMRRFKLRLVTSDRLAQSRLLL
jgi:hypothetical protein